MPVTDTNGWFGAAPEGQRPVLAALRELILAAGPGVVEEFKWGRPCYSAAAGLFCYLHRTRNHVTLGFHRGTALKDPKGLLEGEGKGMRHVKLTTVAEARDSAVGQLVKQAAKLP
jgi:hypothetical protein